MPKDIAPPNGVCCSLGGIEPPLLPSGYILPIKIQGNHLDTRTSIVVVANISKTMPSIINYFKSLLFLQAKLIDPHTIEPYLTDLVIGSFSTKHLLSFRNSLQI